MRAGVDTPPKESAREKLAPARRGLLRLWPEEDLDTGFMIVRGICYWACNRIERNLFIRSELSKTISFRFLNIRISSFLGGKSSD